MVFRRGAGAVSATRGVARVRMGGIALALTGSGALVLTGCGDDGGSPGGEAPAAPAPSDAGLSFDVEGFGSSASTSGVMEVWEGEPTVELSLRGVDAADNLTLFYVAFDGVESVAGAHTFEIGLPGVTPVSGIGIVDDQIYYSLRGQLEIEMTGDGRANGRFGMELAFDDGSGPPQGNPVAPLEAALSLSGSFRSEWTVDCRTRLVGFTGGHYTHDSPYCQSLTF